MLIELSAELSTAAIAADANQIAALDLLLLSGREGNHVLVVEEGLARSLADSVPLSAPALATLGRAANRRAQTLALLSHVSSYVLVTDDSIESVSLVGAHTVRRVPLRHFASLTTSQRSVLLAENLLDARLHSLIGQAFATRRRVKIPIIAELRGGGGSTTAQEFAQLRQDRRFCIAIADSDRNAPIGPVGGTARLLQQQLQTLSVWVTTVHTEAREAENLASMRHIEDVCESDAHLAASIQSLRALDTANCSSLLSFTDLKSGVSLHDVLSFDQPSCDWWCSIVASIRNSLPSGVQHCLAEGVCVNTGNCQCCLIGGIGPTFLARLVDYIGERSLHEVNRTLCPRTLPLWESLGCSVFSWCCGASAQRL